MRSERGAMRTARVNPAQGGEAFKTNSRYCAHGPKTGAASGFRTRDIELGRLAFCQLNYRRFTETAHSPFGRGWEVDLSASRFTLATERPKRCFARHVLRRTSLTNNGQQPLARDFVVHGLSPHRHAEHNGEQQKWPHEEKARHGSHRLGGVAFGRRLHAQNVPGDSRAQLLAQDWLAARAGELLNGWSELGRHPLIAVQPVPYLLLGHRLFWRFNSRRKCRLTSSNRNCAFECFHASQHTTTVLRLQTVVVCSKHRLL